MNWKKIYSGIMSNVAFYQKKASGESWQDEIKKRHFQNGEEDKARRYLIALKYDVYSLLEPKKLTKKTVKNVVKKEPIKLSELENYFLDEHKNYLNEIYIKNVWNKRRENEEIQGLKKVFKIAGDMLTKEAISQVYQGFLSNKDFWSKYFKRISYLAKKDSTGEIRIISRLNLLSVNHKPIENKEDKGEFDYDFLDV